MTGQGTESFSRQLPCETSINLFWGQWSAPPLDPLTSHKSLKAEPPSLLCVSIWETKSDHIQPTADLIHRCWEWDVLTPGIYLNTSCYQAFCRNCCHRKLVCLVLSFWLLYLTVRQNCKQMLFASTWWKSCHSKKAVLCYHFISEGGDFLITGGWSLSSVHYLGML